MFFRLQNRKQLRGARTKILALSTQEVQKSIKN